MTIGAYSHHTDTHYKSWDELVAAEADGYAVIIVGCDPKTGEAKFANIGGKRPTKTEAQKLSRKLRREDKSNYPYTYKFFVRPNWNWNSE